jgi:hypothetical protein
MARNFSPTFKGNFENYKPHHAVELTIGNYSVNDANALTLLLIFHLCIFCHSRSLFEMITTGHSKIWELHRKYKIRVSFLNQVLRVLLVRF